MSIKLQRISSVIGVALLLLGSPVVGIDRLPRLSLPVYTYQAEPVISGTDQRYSFFEQSRQLIDQAEEIQDHVETLLSVRHNPGRMQKPAEYAKFVSYAAHTVHHRVADVTSEIIDSISKSVRYWRYQQAHPVDYFLHKHPAKWVGNVQKEEIKEHITQLEQIQNNYFTHIGLVTEQLQSLSMERVAPSNVSTSIGVLTSILGLTHSEIGIADTLDQQLDALIALCNQIPLYAKRLEREFIEHRIPPVIQRHGLSLAVGAIAVGAYLKARYEAHEWIDVKQVRGEIFVRSNADHARARLLSTIAPFYDVVLMVNPLVNSLVKGMYAKVNILIKGMDYCKSWFNVGESPVTGTISTLLGGASAAMTGVVVGPSIGMSMGYKGDEIKEEITKTTSNVEKHTKKVKQTVQAVDQKITEFTQQTVDTIGQAEQYGQSAVKYGSFCAKLAVTFGLPIAAWASYTLAKSAYATVHRIMYPEPDYYYMRHSLIQLADILNSMLTAQSGLSTQQLGALVYHLRVVSEVSVADEHAEQFAKDVAQLASESYSVAQKLHVIDRMYHTYPFLAVTLVA